MGLFFTDHLEVTNRSGTYTLQAFADGMWNDIQTITGPTTGTITVDAVQNYISVPIPPGGTYDFRWIDTEGHISNIRTLTIPENITVFKIQFDASINPNVYVQLNELFDIDWGDGTTDTDQTNVTHTYTGTDVYTATVTQRGVEADTLILQNVGSVVGLIDLPESITNLGLDGNALTSLPVLPARLINVNLDNNHIDALPILPSTLNYLGCGNNNLVLLPILPSNLNRLYCNDNNLTELPELPPLINNLQCRNNNLPVSQIDDILNQLVLQNLNNGTVDLSEQVPPAPPSNSGLASIGILNSKNWFVTTD
jgi:hypothetical protein